jgi:tungstate transport system substrate-binding protein
MQQKNIWACPEERQCAEVKAPILFSIERNNILMNNKTVNFSSNINIAENHEYYINIVSTFGPVDSGILGKLAEEYYNSTGVRVRYIGVGTGKAIKMAKSGDYDIVMVHAKALEEQFVSDGYGTERIDLMYNDFVIVGPENNPAGIKGMDHIQALNKIKETESLFISRGDNSGTHVKEMDLWKEAKLTPEGNWYNVWEDGDKGNAATLRYTNEQQAYTIIDRATYLTLKDEINLVVLVEGHESLLNFITLIPVSPKKFPQVKHDMAMDFVDYATSEEAQIIIRDFKVDVYGQPLFFPNSAKWREKIRRNE